MLSKTTALQWVLENAEKKKDFLPQKFYKLEEWITQNFTEDQQSDLWRYCDGFGLIESRWVPCKKGFDFGIYEISYVLEGYDDENQEIFSEAPFITPYGQFFIKDLYRVCFKYKVAPYHNN